MNKDPANARWSDMFTGEETGNAAHLDMARIQKFFFTVILAPAYSFALAKMFAAATATEITALRDLDQSVIALLGISHAGYLVSKGVPHSQTQ